MDVHVSWVHLTCISQEASPACVGERSSCFKHRDRGAEGSDKESGANVDTASRQEELSEPQAPFGKYE
jgi:hypothetical protein